MEPAACPNYGSKANAMGRAAVSPPVTAAKNGLACCPVVRNGWAFSHHSGMDAWEIIARENKRGLWRGKFIVPERWRKGERLPGE